MLQDCQDMMTDTALVTFIEGVVKQMSAAFVKVLKGKRFTEWGGIKLRQQVIREGPNSHDGVAVHGDTVNYVISLSRQASFNPSSRLICGHKNYTGSVASRKIG